jgi:TonB family protein
MTRPLFTEYIEPENRPPNLARRAMGLAVTLAFHGLLIYGIVTVRFEVKIVSFKQKVTRVYLAPQEKLELPKDYERRLAGLSQAGVEEGFSGPQSGGIAGGTRRGQDRSASAEPGGATAGPSSTPRQQPASSGFILSYRPGSEKGKVPDLDLSLPARDLAQQRRRSGGPVASDPRLKSYPGTEFFTGSGGEGSGHVLARSGTGDRVIYRGKIPAGAQSYELSAWGRQAVEAIQKHWILPLTKKDRVEGKVGVTVVVEKDGSVSAVRILNSSNISILDGAALAAIVASLPLPRLPQDFPDANLEAYFLFDCYAK